MRRLFLEALLVVAAAIAAYWPALGGPAVYDDSFAAGNFDRVNEGLTRSGLPQPGDLAKFKELGVKTIVDLTVPDDDGEKVLAESLGLRYVNLPWNLASGETGKYDEYKQRVERFLKIADDPKNQPVHVHCFVGRDRTGCMIGAYRIAKQGWTAEQAVEEMKKYGFSPQSFPNLVEFLKRFESDLKKQ